MTTLLSTLRIVERLIGRRSLWRIGRAIYMAARRDEPNSMHTNGEVWLQARVSESVRDREPIVFDVGANVGDWSESMKNCSPAARIFAFEPTPGSYAQLVTVVGKSAAFQCALGSSEGTAKFSVGSLTGGTNSLAPLGNSIEVPITTIAAFTTKNAIGEIDLLKIDVEGFDLEVIRGALPLMKSGAISVIQFEYNWRWMFNRAYLFDAFELTKSVPYELGKLTSSGIEMFPEWHPELEGRFEGNYVLIRSDMVEALGARMGSFDAQNTYALKSA